MFKKKIDKTPKYKIIFEEANTHIVNNAMGENLYCIRMWQELCERYEVSDDLAFFLYGIREYLAGNIPGIELTFLYGFDLSLSCVEAFIEQVRDQYNLDISPYTTMRKITREERIRENQGLGLCPFGDAIGSAAPLCRKYDNCVTCQENEYEDKLYESFGALLKKSIHHIDFK